MRGVGPVEYRDSALIPGLHHDVATGDRNQRAVVRDAVLTAGLRCGQLVVALHLELAARLDGEDGVSAPFLRIGLPALRAAAAAPLVREQDLRRVVVER